MAKTFDDLVSRSMSKASQKRAAQRTKVLLREMLLSDLRKATGYSQKKLATKLKMKQPSLSKLDSGDLIHTTDFRSIYQSVAQEWWGYKDAFLSDKKLKPLGIVKA